MGNFLHQLALAKTEIGRVNVLSSTSSLFTLFLSSIFPSGAVDKMNLSKLFAVVLNIIGIVSLIFYAIDDFANLNFLLVGNYKL